MATTTLPHDAENLPANFEAFLSDEDVKSLEAASSTQSRGMQRRISLVTCSKNAEDLRKILKAEPAVFEDMFNMVEAFKAHAEGLAEVAEAAYARMMLIGLESK